MKQCRVCGETKELYEFVTRNSLSSGKDKICKQCAADYMYFRKHGTLVREKKPRVNSAEIRIENDEEGTKEVLKRLGYDLNSELTVHQQFMIRHNLVD